MHNPNTGLNNPNGSATSSHTPIALSTAIGARLCPDMNATATNVTGTMAKPSAKTGPAASGVSDWVATIATSSEL